MGDSVELGEGRLHVLSEPNEGPLVAHAVAVVGGAEDGDAFAVVFFHVSVCVMCVWCMCMVLCMRCVWCDGKGGRVRVEG